MSKEWTFILGVWIAFVFSFIFGTLVVDITNMQWQDAIQNHGAAEYYLDENHFKKWRWTQ